LRYGPAGGKEDRPAVGRDDEITIVPFHGKRHLSRRSPSMVLELRDQYSFTAARKEKHGSIRHEPGTAFPRIGRDESGRKYLGAQPGRLLAQICTLEPRPSIVFLPISSLEAENEHRQEK
jgi:hypothetical protein